MKKLWVITRAVNAYDQFGEYFVSAFTEEPSYKDIKKLFPNKEDSFIQNLLNGGGRENYEGEWYYLNEIREGEFYDEKI